MEIRSVVIDLVKKFTEFDDFLFSKDYDEVFLTGKYFELKSRDMVCLYFEICNYFNIDIPLDMLQNYEFCSIRGIIDIIEQVLAM